MICVTCAGNQKTLKPNAAIPRQVDAIVRARFYYDAINAIGMAITVAIRAAATFTPCR